MLKMKSAVLKAQSHSINPACIDMTPIKNTGRKNNATWGENYTNPYLFHAREIRWSDTLNVGDVMHANLIFRSFKDNRSHLSANDWYTGKEKLKFTEIYFNFTRTWWIGVKTTIIISALINTKSSFETELGIFLSINEWNSFCFKYLWCGCQDWL